MGIDLPNKEPNHSNSSPPSTQEKTIDIAIPQKNHSFADQNEYSLDGEDQFFDTDSGGTTNGIMATHDHLKEKSGNADLNLETGDCKEERRSDFSDVEVEKREIVVEGGGSGGEQASEEERKSGESPMGSDGQEQQVLLQPHSQLPQPEAPAGLWKSPSNGGEDFRHIDRSVSFSDNFSFDVPSIGKYIRDRSNSFSAAIANRLYSFKDAKNNTDQHVPPPVTEFHLSGLKVTVQLKNKDEDQTKMDLDLRGRITFFSRSNCRDCAAVRSFFRQRGLRFVEINVDVYPSREKELIERTGGSTVPQIFFNEKLFGGLVALNSLRNSGDLEHRLKELLGKRCPPAAAPSSPVYGFEEKEEVEAEERTDEMVGIVRVLRQRLPIQDRLVRLKIVKNCFAGSEMVEVLIHHLDCGRKKAVEIGKEIARKHFIHHVFGENDFEDGNHLYRFLEHEPFIPKCFNFRASTNDYEPKPASAVGQKLTKLMFAILESYASEDRRHVNYAGIGISEEFRRYVNLAQDLQRVDILALSGDEKLAFFINLYNAMVIHAVIRLGCPEGMIDRRTFFGEFQYVVGGYAFSLTAIKNGILRSNRRQPYSLTRPFGNGDKRLELALAKVNPLIHFGLCNGTRSSPRVQFFSSQGIEAELRCSVREFLLRDGMEIDLQKRTVHLARFIKWYNVDFGQERETLKWIMKYLDASKAGLLTHLLEDGGHISIVYQDYDWSLNS